VIQRFACGGGVAGIINCANFFENRFRGSGAGRPRKMAFPIESIDRPYNCAVLPCRLVVMVVVFGEIYVIWWGGLVLIVVSEGSQQCHRTLKYFQAIAHKSWLLSVDWARDCIAQQQLLAPVCSLDTQSLSSSVFHEFHYVICYMSIITILTKQHG